MKLIPRYGQDPVIALDGEPSAIVAPAVRQRRRLLAVLETLSDEQWACPSRCAGWSSRDVIVHLDSTNSFWTLSTAAGLRGEPTQFLASFDPVASPAQLVAGSRALSSAQVLDRFSASTEALTQLWLSLDNDDWSALAEAPPGHVSVSAVAHHALWDSWIHERDILIPLGLAIVDEPDEVIASLRYVAALGPALAINRGISLVSTMVIDASNPDVSVTVDIGANVEVRNGWTEGALTLQGRATDLVEALSVRRPLEQDVPADASWMLSGLLEQFDIE